MKQDIWIFDVDGVITDPKTKEITNSKIIEIIKERLSLGSKVAFNTGRSAEWLEHKVINPLREIIISNVKNYLPLTNLVSICEMGNVVVNGVQVSPSSEENSSFQFQPFSSGGKNVILRNGTGIGDL